MDVARLSAAGWRASTRCPRAWPAPTETSWRTCGLTGQNRPLSHGGAGGNQRTDSPAFTKAGARAAKIRCLSARAIRPDWQGGVAAMPVSFVHLDTVIGVTPWCNPLVRPGGQSAQMDGGLFQGAGSSNDGAAQPPAHALVAALASGVCSRKCRGGGAPCRAPGDASRGRLCPSCSMACPPSRNVIRPSPSWMPDRPCSGGAPCRATPDTCHPHQNAPPLISTDPLARAGHGRADRRSPGLRWWRLSQQRRTSSQQSR